MVGFTIGMAIALVLAHGCYWLWLWRDGPCDWCGVSMRGVRKYWSNHCRDCVGPVTGDCGVYLQGTDPPWEKSERYGQWEP